MSGENVKIEVVGGLCELTFTPFSSTGVDPDTNPGVAFQLKSDRQCFQDRTGKFYHGVGVIGRADAIRLRDMLEIFLKNGD